MKLTTSQQNTIDKLLNTFSNKEKDNFASLKAPTGSGKTFIASEFISRILAHQSARKRKTIIAIATVSNADLPKQLASKLEDYKIYHDYNNYNVEHIQSPSAAKTNKAEDIPEFTLEPNKVFVFGTSSFGKNSLFYQNKTLEIFLQQLKYFDYDLIFIRDEAHIGKKESINKEDLSSFDTKMKQSATFILEMTATPKSNINLVEMTAKDLELDNQYLLKTTEIKDKVNDEAENEEIIDNAINQFLKTKKEYQKLDDIVINPAMLIQVVNQSNIRKDPEKHQLFNEGLELLEFKLQKAGLKYLKYLDNKPEVFGTNVPATLKYASEIDSHIDAIIFKVGPATGWDIPRANMLLQLRNVSSETLNIQTLGRIMRNPYPRLAKNEITDKYYLWSNFQKPTRDQATYKLKDQFKELELPSGYIDRESIYLKESTKNYVDDAKAFIRSKNFQNKLKEINSDPNENVVYNSGGTGLGKDKIPNHIYLKIYNYKKSSQYEDSLHISMLEEELARIAKRHKVHFEIAKYTLLLFTSKLYEIKNHTSKWQEIDEPWKLEKLNRLMPYYNLWKDNNKLKYVETDWFDNYGYLQVTGDEDIQYLDSIPEKEFFKRFKKALKLANIKEGIEFFAKMPTLGSKISFEYYNQELGIITKSFADFVIKYKGKIIFVEVKAYDKQDYSPEKTKMILKAYRKYTFAEQNDNIDFAIFMYDKKVPGGQSILNCKIGNKWIDDADFEEFIKDKFC